MKIEINSQQNLLKINNRRASVLTSFFMEKASRLIPERRWQDISLVIADHELMCCVNEEFTGDDCTTDVLSFCMPPMPGGPDLYSGELFVNAEIALERKKKDFARELALYIAHGCDHLMDEDDSDRASRQRMRNRELRWLREADTMGILKDIASPAGKGSTQK
jgi:rRNA maturation RNase YbeY